MRALTLIRPMSAALVWGTKDIENRPKDLPKAMKDVETVIAVHAGKKYDEEYEELIRIIDTAVSWSGGYIDDTHKRRPTYHTRFADEGIIGLVRLSGRVFTDATPLWKTSPWWAGPYGYEVIARLPFEHPIPCKGMLGFWTVPPELEAQIVLQPGVTEGWWP